MTALLLWALAQEKPPIPPGHSLHGEAFNEGPRRAARLLEGMGNLRFPITTTDHRAQEYFDQGVGQLHVFYHFEAERSFRQAAALDPACAMAYWGMAMANINNEKRAAGFLEKATARAAGSTPRERAWIKVLQDYYAVPAGEGERRARTYVKGLEAIVYDFPEDLEARAFLAWTLWHHSGKGLPISSRASVDALIADVLAANPMHPGAHHYRIHLWDDEKPARALESAARLGLSAPGIAHAWHMPGHTYSKLHRYAETALHQEASARVDHAHLIAEGVMPWQIHNYAHNNQWLVLDLSYVGRVREAIAVAENLIAIPRHPVHNKLDDSGSCARQGRSRLMELLVEWELWDELLARADTTLAPIEAREDTLQRARALAAAGRDTAGELEQLRKSVEEAPAADEAAKKKRDEELKPIVKAIEEIKKGREPPKNPPPGQVAPLMRHARRLLEQGDGKGAREACRNLADLAGEADPGLVEPFLREHGLSPASRRVPAFDREALGPLLWSPPAAPETTLVLHPPTIVIFFLGSGCSHCVQQLGKFKEIAGSFRDAGLTLTAVSTESAEHLAQGEYPFPLLPDPNLRIFKRFHCYDDFERIPLHGTFLIDGASRIRWQEIAYTPFMEASFLLEESKRLLRR